MFIKSDIEKLKYQLAESQNVVIVTHTNPDGDAIGSSLGLKNFLLKKKQNVTVIVPNSFPKFLSWMHGSETIIDFEKKTEEATKLVEAADIIFCLDFNNLKRIDELGVVVGNSEAEKVLIDHHLQPDNFADIIYSDTKACSTCQMVFELIEMMHEKHFIDAQIAECLYCGIMTDTASFRFDSTTARTHQIAAQLIEMGVVKSKVHGNVYDTNSEDRLRLLGYCLSEKLEIISDAHTSIIALKQEEQKKYKMQKGDTEGFVNYGLSIEGINLSAFFMEKENQVKISFRSRGNIDVNTFARLYFNGGGHMNAAGAESKLSLDETVSKFKELLKTYKF